MLTSSRFLSYSAGFTLIGIVAIVISILFENWMEYQVDRREILDAFNREPELNIKLKDAYIKNSKYFNRNEGLFFVCFPDFLPSESGTFRKPITGAHCLPTHDYFPSDAVTEGYTKDQTYHLWLIRAIAVLYILGLVSVAFFMLLGFIGCWTRSTKVIGWCTLVSLFAVMFIAGALACWHTSQRYEQEILNTSPYFQSWEPILKRTTRSHYSYGYVMAWVGIFFLGLATILLFLGRRRMKKDEERDLCAKQGYIMPSYFDQKAMVPYGYNTYGGYGAYPYYNQYNNGGYYGYMTYGR